MRLPLLVLCALTASIAQTPASAAEWQAGFAAVRITPEAPVPMAGYASRNHSSEGTAGDLFAKALALLDANGERAVWITTDLIGLRGAVTEEVARRIMADTGLERRQLLFNSSHAHTGPAIAESDIAAYGIGDQAATHMRAYRRMLEDRLVTVVEQALSRLEPVELSYGAGVVPFVMNRREFTRDRGVILGVNPRGPADRTMPLLRVARADGKLRAVVFGAAVHNTTLTGDEYRISGDYAGFAQQYVETELPGVQAMFVQGFAGDANPYPRGTMELARQHGETLGREVIRVLGTKLAPVRGPLNLQLDFADLPLARIPDRAELQKMTGPEVPSWKSWTAARMLEALDAGRTLPASYRAPVALWQFGEDLTLVALSGEVVSDYVHLIERAIGPVRLWLSAYNNDVFGYFPSAQVLADGGYETRGVVHGALGIFAPAAQEAVLATVRELAAKAGRLAPPAPVRSGGPRESMLVSSAWLAAHLNDRNLVLLHVGDKAEYDARHIPGARFISPRDIAAPAGAPLSLTLEMPRADALRQQLAGVGISDSSRVVVYYGKDWVSPATRVVFTLLYAGLTNVSLLDGGMESWIRNAGALTDVVPPARTGTLTRIDVQPFVVDAAFVQSHLGTPGFAVVDARDRAFYDGTQEGGPRDHRRRGHISGAHSVPFSEAFDGDFRLKSAEQLAQLFAAGGVKPGDTVIAYCHIGQQATAVMFAARTLGHRVLLYDGSFEDWARRDLPVDAP